MPYLPNNMEPVNNFKAGLMFLNLHVHSSERRVRWITQTSNTRKVRIIATTISD